MQATIETEKPLAVTDVIDVVQAAVLTVARRLPAHVDRDELQSAGYLALMRAFPKAPRSESEARAYLLRRVAGALRDELRRADGAGRRTRHLLRQVERASAALEQSLGRVPSYAEIGDLIGIPVDRIEAVIARGEASTRVTDGDSAMAVLPDAAALPSEATAGSELLGHVLALLDMLTAGERVVVVRTVLDGRSLDEAAAELGVTKGRVSQLRKAGLARLRAQPEAAQLWAAAGFG